MSTATATPTAIPTATASRLELDLVRGRSGRTQLARVLQEFPQRVTVPMYLDLGDPGMAFLCVQNPTGGLFPGDHLSTAVAAGPGTSLHLTHQSATQVFAGDGSSRQSMRFDLTGDAFIEHFPKSVIPHAASRHAQDTHVEVSDGSAYVGWEALAAGRIGHGERFAYGSYRATTSIHHDGALCARDVLDVTPGRADPRIAGLLGEYDYVASMVVVAPAAAGSDLAAHLTEALLALPDVTGAASALPYDVGASVRLLARHAPALRRAQLALRAAARRRLQRCDELSGRL
ncbi:urease accessory protein [Blastococcus aurantiacus]|uniref:Urease accessory protein UreD n=1 Tax=Blastococcus aurantiacus TaxID=1550231 RepID=A0A1G7MSJ0_9ACTN|nr:urease accessory protein UreD [Blastococcus aurantiacus]SDF64079.1 urease accessory protein [Blastococcus aurantiacus]